MLRVILISLIITLSFTLPLIADDEIKRLALGERIAFFAERFVGTPYDPDPMGEYVSKKVIVLDERVDCMYLTFRAVELGMSNTPQEAESIALNKRFLHKGILGEDSAVLNYEDRFQYGEDMLESGKWGSEITGSLGNTALIEGSRGKDSVIMLPKTEISDALPNLKSGDIVFFIKSPLQRIRDEIVGHIGIIKKEGNALFLIHASGEKSNKAGSVKKVLFLEYILTMPFIGIKISRF